MKYILVHLSIFVLTFQNFSFCQSVLFLHSGDKINGKFEAFKNDTIIFKFQGNMLKFKSSDIHSIYFNSDDAPPNKSNSFISNDKKSLQDERIFGVITYYFNQNYGDKPDIGAKVAVIDSSEVPDFKMTVADSFYFGNSYRNMYLTYKFNKKEVPQSILREVKKYKVEEKSEFDALDEKSIRNIFKIILSKKKLNSTADGNGNYSIKVKPGTYYIYIESNNRKGLSMTESQGKVIINKVKVKEGVEYNISHNFGLQ